jgi:diguanylate cyclase (GGDEF)-like protein
MYVPAIAYMSQLRLSSKTDENLKMEKGQRNKNLEFLTSLFEHSLKNNFADALRYLGANSRHLISNLSLFVSLNAETKECFVFSHRKVKKSYLSFVLENIREFALKISVDLNPSEYSIKILPNEEFISDEGLTQPEFTFTIPVFAKGKVAVFLSFSKHGHFPPEEDVTYLNLVVNFLSALQEREEKEKSEKENIEKLVFIDSLTGVLNRRAFYQIFPQDISEGRRSGAILSLVVFDIDEFKQMNDSYGHAFGDMILKQVTSKFKSLLREEDKMFRLGGDEFAVVMKTDKRQAFSAIQRILKEISDGNSPRITLSGGIAEIHPFENTNIDDVVRQADKALYLAKEGGKNQILFYENERLNTKSDELIFNKAILQFTEDINLKLKELAVQQLISLYSSFSRKGMYIHSHSITVSDFAMQLGKELNLSEKKLKNLKFGATLYDIGMIAVPEEILFKNRKLTPVEYDIIKRHTIMGGRIIQRFPILRDVLPIVLYHHEWINGQGYPFGLSGDSIPIESRIVAVADAFHAMRSNRLYRSAIPGEKAISEIINNRGTKYDPQVVEVLLRLVEKRLIA